MDISNEQAAQLLEKYNNGTATAGEMRTVEDWYLIESERRQQQPLELDYLLVKQQIWAAVQQRTATTGHSAGRWKGIYGSTRLWAAAAAIMVCVVGGILLLNRDRSIGKGEVEAYANDISPGTTSATLILSDGKKILLSSAASGELAKEAGVSIVKTSSGQLVYEIKNSADGLNKINTLSTSNGETYQVRLPDGTAAWLNAASSITYPASFANMDKRSVTTTGEVYFEVAKDKAHPFVVESAEQKVEVLGTHFNINSYPNETVVRTTLLEGSVRITGNNGAKGMLRPGQQAVVSSGGGELKVSQADTELATAWKDNKFMFDGESIQGVMRMVERWYNVEVVYEGELPKETFIGGVSRFDKVSRVLRKLESTGGVHFRVEGRKIYVSR